LKKVDGSERFFVHDVVYANSQIRIFVHISVFV